MNLLRLLEGEKIKRSQKELCTGNKPGK